MSATTPEAYEQFLARIREIHHLDLAAGILHWDQHTQMPPRGAGQRAGQLEALAGIIHERTTDPRLLELLEILEQRFGDLDIDARVIVREMRRTIDRARRVPRELVREISATQAAAHLHWVEARDRLGFAHFAPWLEKMVRLKRHEAEALGFQQSPYDALLDEHEPQATAADVATLFDGLRPRLVEIARAIAASGLEPRRDLLTRRYPLPAQRAFCAWLLRRMGYDSSAGRVDEAPHPFTVGALADVRVTTRYREDGLATGIFAALHEGGHALYEQGLDPEYAGTPRAVAASLGIHESQSRLWENLVGRSLPFWEFAFPFLQAFFPEQTHDIRLEEWYPAINDVRPSLIRVEADEVTYNLHILLRFELEQALLEGRLEVAGLPEAWNVGMRELLGVEPTDDASGVLQDVHWAMGLFGYFPTYTLGNLYAAQLFAAAQRELPDLQQRIAAGDLAALKHWTNERIHRPGRTWSAAELVQVVTGEPLDPEYLITHLRRKYSPLYGGWA